MKRKTRFLAVCLLAAVLMAGCLIPAQALGSTKVTMNKSIKMNDGKATIGWKVKGDEPSFYYVQYQVTDNGDAKQGKFTMGLTFKNSIETGELVPGYKYTVFVLDSSGKTLAKKNYTVPEAKTFKDGKLKNTSVKISVEFRKKTGYDKYQKQKTLKAADIKKALKDGENIYGLKYTMRMPTLSRSRTYHIMLAFESPDGFVCADKIIDYTFEKVSGAYETVWFEMAGNTFFKAMYSTTGKIPKGKYKAMLFWDGMWVNTYTFSVK